MTNGQSVKKKQTVNKKQKLTIIICASVFAVLLVVYLAVIRPLLKPSLRSCLRARSSVQTTAC